MLKLEDRLRIAMGADMGCQLTAADVRVVAGWLVALRAIQEGIGGAPKRRAKDALGEFASQR